ncbi:MAG: hypothetical protein ACKOD4_02670, partial [Candidatus Limnocylindrus sp.]
MPPRAPPQARGVRASAAGRDGVLASATLPFGNEQRRILPSKPKGIHERKANLAIAWRAAHNVERANKWIRDGEIQCGVDAAITATKGNSGHTLGAAGALGAAATICAMR